MGVSVFVVAVFLPFAAVLLHRIRWRLDVSSALILGSFAFCFAVRLAVAVLCLDPDNCQGLVAVSAQVVTGLRMVNSFVDKLKWLILYFCVLEMQEVRVKVESESLTEYQKKIRSLNRVKCFLVVFFLVV